MHGDEGWEVRSIAAAARRERTPIVAVSWLALLLVACSDPLFLMFEEHLRTPEGEHLAGAGCESIGDGTSGSGSAGPGGPSYSVEHEGHDGEGVRVLVRDGTGRVRAMRAYNEDFLLSGDVDEFEIELDAQTTLRLRYWGGTTCEEPREPDGGV